MISVIVPAFRNVSDVAVLIDMLRRQQFPSNMNCEIIVVDDGSADGSAEQLRRHEDSSVLILALPENVGRARARNAGAALAQGEVLVFIDCDCRPAETSFLAAHAELLGDGVVASCGGVTGTGQGFWSRYQEDASNRRRRQHAKGFGFVGSTQNFAVRATTFHQVGGFDSRYSGYGFEDRDLFARLARVGRIRWCERATVRHMDTLTLGDVLKKMRLAAGDSAIRFSRDHADAYRALGYAALDTRLHRNLRPVAVMLRPLLRTAWFAGRLVESSWLPYIAAKSVVKSFVALSYLVGTLERSA